MGNVAVWVACAVSIPVIIGLVSKKARREYRRGYQEAFQKRVEKTQAVIQSLDLKMWSDPGWNRIMETNKRTEDAKCKSERCSMCGRYGPTATPEEGGKP